MITAGGNLSRRCLGYLEFFHDYGPARAIPLVTPDAVLLIETDNCTAGALDALSYIFHGEVRFTEEFQDPVFLSFCKRSSLHVTLLSASSLP